MAVMDLGHAAVSSGWRKKVADAASPRVADRAPVAEPHVRTAIGLALFAISVVYVVRTVRAAVVR